MLLPGLYACAKPCLNTGRAGAVKGETLRISPFTNPHRAKVFPLKRELLQNGNKIMIFTQEKPSGQYILKDYKPGCIKINDKSYTRSLIVGPKLLIEDWPPQSLQELLHQHFTQIIEHHPEIVLLGTGKQFSMPSHALLSPFYENKIGIECMDTGAACRTFVALSSEGRHVIAALLIK